MIKIPNNCTGCSACINVCPKQCFSWSETKEGFRIPVVSPEDCIKCGLCEKVCPSINNPKQTKPQKIYALQSLNKEILRESSSGGIFSEIAIFILNHNGIVYGSAIDYSKNYIIRHIRIDCIENLKQLRGSKYVQSEINGIFKQIKNDLDNEKLVLFTGTPCQVIGLKRYLLKGYPNLITIDIICHGSPSPLVWQKYLHYKKGLNPHSQNAPINFISFRDKRNGWNKYGISFAFQNSLTADGNNKPDMNMFHDRYEDPYMKGFLNDLFIRPSCHNCPVKGFSSSADITLADAWGIEKYSQVFNIEYGVSTVIPLSQRGNELIESLPVVKEEVPIKMIEIHNPAAFISVRPHKNRKLFFKLIKKDLKFDQIIQRCLPPPNFFDKIIWSVNKRLKYLKK